MAAASAHEIMLAKLSMDCDRLQRHFGRHGKQRVSAIVMPVMRPVIVLRRIWLLCHESGWSDRTVVRDAACRDGGGRGSTPYP